jgi:hypothetical protein
MTKILRTLVRLAAASALVLLWAPTSGAEDSIKTAPVHSEPSAVCALSGVVAYTNTHGINLHPTKNVYDFDSANITCLDLNQFDYTTLDGSFEVNLMGDTTGITHTAADPSITGETCDEGQHTTISTGTATDVEAPHLGDSDTAHAFFQRMGLRGVFWGTLQLPTTGHQTFRITFDFIPTHLEEEVACDEGLAEASGTPPDPMVKITTFDLAGYGELYPADTEVFPEQTMGATITRP